MDQGFTDTRLFEFRRIQNEMREKVIVEDDFIELKSIAGGDVAYVEDTAYAACVVLDRELKVLGAGTAVQKGRGSFVRDRKGVGN